MSQQQAAPGSMFDVPGVPGGETEWFEQYDDTNSLALTWQQGSQTQVNGITKFRQTDVVTDWEMEVAFSQTFTAGTGQTLTSSPYAPWNFVGPILVPIQNQYASMNVPNGIDAYIFDLIRPSQRLGEYIIAGANPFGAPNAQSASQGYPQNGTLSSAAGNAQTNLIFPTPWTSGTSNATTFTLDFRLPASVAFDVYWDRAITGEATSAPHAAIVSPQYMAGTTRNILPQVKLNQLLGSTLDNAPVNTTALTPTSDSASTASATGTLTMRRRGVFAGNPAVSPIEYPWQYRRFASQYGIGNQSTWYVDIPNETGQLMSWYLRLFDPGANSSLGAPVALSTISFVEFNYGSGLQRFYGTPQELQRLFVQKHKVLLPPGVLAFDMALTDTGLITNTRLLNTLTTAGMRIKLTFSSNPGTSSYAVLGLESLVYVT